MHAGRSIGDDVYLPVGTRLLIDASQGPVQIFSHGAGIIANGGVIETIGTSPSNTINFDAEPDVASWDGLTLATGLNQANQTVRASGQFDYTSIQHALTAIQINSGSTALTGADSKHYGLIVTNSGIGPSYFDGIDAVNTPVQVLGQADGRFGTLNNIGSQGMKITFDPSLPNYPAQALDSALDVEKVVFGSSVPFAETSCPSLQPCAAGSIGNDAIQGQFTPGRNAVTLTSNRFYRAGSFGVELHGPGAPAITNNTFICNGSGSPKPVVTCDGTLLRYSAIYVDNMTGEVLGADTTVGDGEGIHGNVGQQNGLDVIAINGTVTSDLKWQTPTNQADSHALGYIVANGDLEVASGKRLTVGDSDIVKAIGGAIKLNGATFDASSSGAKTFTSLRDNSSGIAACPSVFAQSCPDPLPPNDWTGISMVAGADARINNATIAYATTGIQDLSGALSTRLDATYGPQFGLVVTNSTIGPSFANGVAGAGSPIALVQNQFTCPQVVLPSPACPNGVSTGNQGVVADFSQSGPLNGGLLLDRNHFVGTVKEAIKGLALSNQKVYLNQNLVEAAEVYGIQLQNASNPTITANQVTNSGIGSPIYPAIYLPGIDQADFNQAIRGNVGSGNGLDSIAFDGKANGPLDWQLGLHNNGPMEALGYMLDGSVEVNGSLRLPPGVTVPALHALIKVRNGALNTAAGAAFTSLKEVACDTVFAPNISATTPNAPSVCQAPVAGDWLGLDLDATQNNTLSGTELRYPATGIRADQRPGVAATGVLSLSATSIRNVFMDGIHSDSPIVMTGGQLTNSLLSAGSGIWTDNPGSGAVQITNVGIDHAGTYGIVVNGSDNPMLTGNTITNSGLAGKYPAIYLNGLTDANFLQPAAPPAPSGVQSIQRNIGARNGLDALVFHGKLASGDLTWLTARKTIGDPAPLGYLLDGTLKLTNGKLTVDAGDVVKTLGAIDVNRLDAAQASNGSQKIFTSLADNSVGIQACPSQVLQDCGVRRGAWPGITLNSDGVLVNAVIRYAATGIAVNTKLPVPFGPPDFRLVVARSRIDSTENDAIASVDSVSVTDTSISDAYRGVNADFTGAAMPARLRLSGNRITGTRAEGVLGQSLAGQTVWASDNRIDDAGTFGMRLMNANKLVLRNNIVTRSGNGAVVYPSIYLSAVTADFVNDVRGNRGSGNGLDAIAMDGTVTSDLNWITPGEDSTGPAPRLGYMLDGGLTITGHNLNLNGGAVVKALGGPITIDGGALNAGSQGAKTFTSWKDDSPVSPTAPNFKSCPTFFSPCKAQSGDWGGIVITGNGTVKGTGNLQNATINYANTAIAIDSGPIVKGEATNARLTVAGSRIVNVSRDGINSLDTPISVDSTVIGDPASTGINVGGHGIIASFLSPANCPPASLTSTCERLHLTGNRINWTGEDGIVANGLSGQPVNISAANTITHARTYGIRLVGADLLTLQGNIVTQSGRSISGSHVYPAIYLPGVSGQFKPSISVNESSISANAGDGNGLNALVFHGTSTGDLLWNTPSDSGPFGYLLDGSLTVNGTLTTKPNDVVKTLNGGITINGALSSAGTLFTSLKDSEDKRGIVACNSVLVPEACPSSAHQSDWDGITVSSVAPSAFTEGQILFAGTGIANTGTGQLSIDCSSIRSNGTGVKPSGTDSITQSDVYSNTVNINIPAGVTADYDWFGTTTQQPNAKHQLMSQRPTATLTPSSANLVAAGPPVAVGIGNMTVTATFSRKMADTPVPDAAFGLTTDGSFPHPLTTASPTSVAFSQNRMVWTYDPYLMKIGLAQAGRNTIRLDGARSCVPAELPDSSDSNLMTTAKDDFIAAIKPTTLVVLDTAGPYGGTADIRAVLTDGTQGLSGEPVAFTLNGKPAGSARTSATPDLGGATLAKASLGGIPAGTYSGINGVQAHFAGDADNFYSPAPGPTDSLVTATLTVGPASTTTLVQASPSPSFYGEDVTWTATVKTLEVPGTQPSGEGTVTFRDGSGYLCHAVSLNPGTNQATCTSKVIAVSASPDTVTATYNPSTNFTLSSGTIIQAVQPAGTTTKLSRTGGSTPSTYGQSASWTATVSTNVNDPGTDPNAEGKVAFYDGSATTPICDQKIITGNSVTCTVNSLAAGTHSITAKYNPSPNFTTSQSAALTQDVNQATATVTTTPSAGGGLGTLLTESMTVSGGPNPGGSATFKLYGPDDSMCNGANLLAPSNPISLAGGKATSAAYQPTVAGTYYWIVNYSGDGNFGGMNGACGDPVPITSDIVTTTQLGSFPTDPSSASSTVTLKATIAPSLASEPAPGAGSVNFQAAGTQIACGGSTAPVTLTGGSATCLTDYRTINGQALKATYSGTMAGTVYDASAGSLLGSATVLNDPGPIASGATLTLTANVTPTLAGGTVAFFDGTDPITVCKEQTITAAGVATCSYTVAGAGPHPLTAIYSGSGTYETSEGKFP